MCQARLRPWGEPRSPTHACEDAVHWAHARRAAWHEAAHVREDDCGHGRVELAGVYDLFL